MQKQDTVLRTGFALFSVITSFLFVFYGVRGISGHTASAFPAFAYVTAGYGLANLYILSWVWRSEASWAPGVMLGISTGYLAIFSLEKVNAGLQSGGSIAILCLALVLLVNWLAVRKLANHSGAETGSSQKGSPATPRKGRKGRK